MAATTRRASGVGKQPFPQFAANPLGIRRTPGQMGAMRPVTLRAENHAVEMKRAVLLQPRAGRDRGVARAVKMSEKRALGRHLS